MIDSSQKASNGSSDPVVSRDPDVTAKNLAKTLQLDAVICRGIRLDADEHRQGALDHAIGVITTTH